jgi:uncharacterized membrane protein YdbT with pleckstrin-like domain
MSYIDKNLLPQEKLVYRGRLHRIIYLPSIICIAAALVAFAVGAMQAQGDRSGDLLIGSVLLVIGAVIFIGPWIKDKTSEFGVTNKRVLIKVGLIKRTSLELLLRQIEGISVEQSVVARILGFGTIVVSGTGGTKERFGQIANPMEFRKQVQAQSISDGAPVSTAAPSVAEEKTCPSCAEQVKRAAKVCRYCGHKFE